VRLEEAWDQAQRNNDTTAFLQLLAPDLTFIGTSGSFRDRSGYIASRSGSWIPRAATFTVTELLVRIYGETAIVTGRGTTTGAGVEGSVRFTDVWLRRHGKWQLVAVHRTEIS
jgi:ketosteroid isomerase-like protein